MTTRRTIRNVIIIFIVSFLFLPVFSGSSYSAQKSKTKPKTAAAVQKDFSLEEIKKEIKRVVTSGVLSSTRYGIYIKSLKTGEIIFSANENLQLIPASNMKVITSAAALGSLGPEYTFNTDLYSPAKPQDGIINGNIYIKGSGNPVLYPEDIWVIAKELASFGITEVKGDIVIDGSYLDKSIAGKKIENNSYSTIFSSLSLNFNSVKYTISPYNKSSNGESPFVSVDPFSSYLSISNEMKKAAAPDYNSSQVIIFKNNDNGEKVAFKGDFNGKVPLTGYSKINNPLLFSGESFKKMLTSQGIKVSGNISEGLIPDNAFLLYRHRSKPLTQILIDMNKYSNNFIADHILVAIGAKEAGSPASILKSTNAVTEFLKKNQIATEGIKIVDGSGLSKDNRLSALAISTVLENIYMNLSQGPEFLASLPIMGVDGTLRNRLTKSTFKRHIRAKTGYVNGTTTLSGYVMTEEKEPIVFSILINNCKDILAAKLTQDHIVETIAAMKRKTDKSS